MTRTRFAMGALAASVLVLLGITAHAMYVELRDTDVWRDSDGDPVPTSQVQSHHGPEHCDQQDLVFLTVGAQMFVRDPDRMLPADAAAAFEAHADLPGGALDTGWTRDGQELWLAADGSAAYLDTGDDFETWPRLVRPEAAICM